MYANDNKGFTPWRGRAMTSGAMSGTIQATQFLGPDRGGLNFGAALLVAPPKGGARQNYLTSNDVFFCPSDTVRAPFRDPVTGWGRTSMDPSVLVTYNSTSYWIWYYPAQGYAANSMLQPLPWPKIDNESIFKKGASQRMIWADQLVPMPPDTGAVKKIHPNFHKEGANMLYLDGHVTFVRESALSKYAMEQGITSYGIAMLAGATVNY
jgi:prepilin-type processing-associated H-X9-DG protein